MTRPTGTAAILPNGMKLGWHPATLPLDTLIWPLGQPARLKGKALRDLSADDHLVVFPRETLHVRPSFGTRARVSVAVTEPAAIHGLHLRALRQTYRRFHRVLTTDESLLGAIPNGIFFPFGSTWVPDWRTLDTTKAHMCSLIASAKRSQTGHVLRHAIAGRIAAERLPVDLMGSGYAPFETKSDGLAPYRYSVIIENVREKNYFTEKLVDAILCDTVPLYWGCPNIADFLDTSGMLICNSENDIRDALATMSTPDYAARLPRLRAIKHKAAHYGDIFTRAAHAVLGDGA